MTSFHHRRQGPTPKKAMQKDPSMIIMMRLHSHHHHLHVNDAYLGLVVLTLQHCQLNNATLRGLLAKHGERSELCGRSVSSSD